MKIGIIGATGKSGSLLAAEALKQGHDVTGIVRFVNRVRDSRIHVLESDLFELNRNTLKSFDVVINAFRAPSGKEEEHLTSVEHLIAVFEDLPDVRFMMVGGAGSLYVDLQKKIPLYTTPDFPKDFLPTAANMAKAFSLLEKSTINWTYMSPAIEFDYEGKRTGRYTLGKDNVITNTRGESYISYADYALAMIDEVKNQAFIRQRFTAVSERG
ncbi:NAD(P)H-binding protein [Oxalobacter vibrioformis]|uniref:NAD(P)H-binding protein n=1 Tax=Oxalobacter vibrioformis TaxID=933080 RepID=A0A9E9LVH7_9BURK|nr:NAD(P)H-binding protein [Oxalobacter vibrioformis]WAW09921.1 NAD(P)H-binding protein [Oxalobacter vibrioformis]